MNIVGANDAAAALQEMVQPFAGMAPQYVMDTLQSFARRSSPKTKPRVEMAPGTYKSEIVTYPPNFFEKKLKFLLELQKKKDEKEQKEKQNG
ncbi:unnamed protein product [Arctia plantaginis]|nr:unnamed protein product [Arctia plantaginis]